MYRIKAKNVSSYIHIEKIKGTFTYSILFKLVAKPTPGRAKKFLTRDDAMAFIEEIDNARRYFIRCEYTLAVMGEQYEPSYKFLFGLRNQKHVITKEITAIDWEVEAIHDETMLTHDELCKAACTFLREKGCALVVNQPAALCNDESPDAIGFHGYSISHLVEAKTSRSDFLSDANKPFRLHPYLGVGGYRWFICEPDLIRMDELPENWGLVYATKWQRTIVKDAAWQGRNIDAEMYLLYQTARRGLGGRDKEEL